VLGLLLVVHVVRLLAVGRGHLLAVHLGVVVPSMVGCFSFLGGMQAAAFFVP
jgi:hypothetical protein